MEVGIPEMTLLLSNNRLVHCSVCSKVFSMPPFERLLTSGVNSSWIVAYQQRSAEYEHLSLMQYLRKFTKVGTQYKRYKDNEDALVGVSIGSLTSKNYLLNFSILHYPFRQVNDIFPHNYEEIRDCLLAICSALKCHPEFWNDNDEIRNYFLREAHNEYYTENFILKVGGLKKLLDVSLCHKISKEQLTFSSHEGIDEITLGQKQAEVSQHIKGIMSGHPSFTINEYGDCVLEDNTSVPKFKPILIHGEPGTKLSSSLYFLTRNLY